MDGEGLPVLLEGCWMRLLPSPPVAVPPVSRGVLTAGLNIGSVFVPPFCSSPQTTGWGRTGTEHQDYPVCCKILRLLPEEEQPSGAQFLAFVLLFRGVRGWWRQGNSC